MLYDQNILNKRYIFAYMANLFQSDFEYEFRVSIVYYITALKIECKNNNIKWLNWTISFFTFGKNGNSKIFIECCILNIISKFFFFLNFFRDIKFYTRDGKRGLYRNLGQN